MSRAHLEDVETFVVDHASIVPQQLHDDLQVLARINVLRHDVVVGSVEEDLAQQLDRLPLCNVAFRLDQYRVVSRKERIEIRLQVARHQAFVFCKDILFARQLSHPLAPAADLL